MKKIRCAIYTRKSSEEGLEQEFNSLDAQREACEAYIASQKHEGWVLQKEAYDDGGLSGGSLERPALQRLLDHLEVGRIDQIVVYKIDRLTRSLTDFSKIVDILDAANASFVSVTQSFNTATSMGRLTLNMLLSFAQFEREVTAERIRDKIAASKRKGLWMGGNVPIGYEPDGRTLKINKEEAEVVSTIYDLYEQHGSIRAVREEAQRLGLRTRRRHSTSGNIIGGGLFDRGHIYYVLTNPVFAGRIRHKKTVYDGLHDAIVDPDRWDQIQVKLKARAKRSRLSSSSKQKSLLCGKLFDETGDRLTPSHTKTRKGVRLRYYISNRLVTLRRDAHPDAWRLPALALETAVAEAVRSMLKNKELISNVVSECAAEDIVPLQGALTKLTNEADSRTLLDLIDRIDIAPGSMRFGLDGGLLAKHLGISRAIIDADALTQNHPFRLKKRGVETKLILTDAPGNLDETLIRNVANAHAWFEQLKKGKSFSDLAEANSTSARRIQQVIELAFLAPDIVRDILDGKQPVSLTAKWFSRHSLPSDWSEQRQLLATL